VDPHDSLRRHLPRTTHYVRRQSKVPEQTINHRKDRNTSFVTFGTAH